MAWDELGAADDEVCVGVTVVGVAAVEPAAADGTVGAVAVAAGVTAVLVEAAVVDGVADGVAVGVDAIVEVEPVAPVGAFAFARSVAVTTAPLPGVTDRNEDELGWRMFATARGALPSPRAARNPTACGGAITIPIDAASCSIRWSSPSVATL